ncbi:hypothetical protein SAMN04487969_106156 [Paenibacillus algorifonticola]|uniref:Transcription initiation factor TFIID n=1 Tax=Paenibacillus algorifonticola TaxID=684063 RepID=A0A1I2D775_9BACL|nr:hypothetical protein [Paenibacillus algorifonticola]SFE76345.1 hypothetical protein SAMN04487969_106156 [Paenibacillus algorifonticola]
MRELLERYAADYAAAEQMLSGHGDDQSIIHYPTVFLYIGDEAGQAIEPMIQMNAAKWENSAGVIYFHAASTPRGGGSASGSGGQASAAGAAGASAGSYAGSNAGYAGGNGRQAASAANAAKVTEVVLDGLSSFGSDHRTGRKELWEAFRGNAGYLADLNRALRGVSDTIADYGRLYASFDRLHLAVITRADDPMNALVPDISLLAQAIFQQSFKSVQMDLYTLISEREQMDTFAHASAIGVSFLRELEGMQQPDYTFSALLEVTGDGLAIPVIHPPSPLFDLVYVLSDRNEKGMTAVNGIRDNYDIICHIQLLKNRKRKDAQVDVAYGGYNNSTFKNSLRTESGRQGFVSAGLSKVKRPNYSIALTVLYHLHMQLSQLLAKEPELSMREKLACFGLDPASVDAMLTQLLPSEEQLADMTGLLTSGVRYEQLKPLSLHGAEEELFGEGASVFFHNHFTRTAQQRLSEFGAAPEMRRAIAKFVRERTDISFYQLCAWTEPSGEDGSVLAGVRSRIKELVIAVEQAREELERTQSGRAEDVRIQRLPFMDKQNLRSFIRAFFGLVYGQKWELLRLELELSLYRRLADELEQLHELYRLRVKQMTDMADVMKTTALQSIKTADDYIGQNIFEYYARVTGDIVLNVQDKRGAGIWFDERYLGSAAELLEQGNEAYVNKLSELCLKHVLTAEPFAQTFEEELLRRANVTIDYSNRQALAKEDLFKRLYRTLEENASINVRLLDYTHEHRYEEKYMFGDADSEFVQYALGVDETSRIYKFGCIHEKRSSGVEKLNLMGGFHLEDLLYYRNGKVYYETYRENGYAFHGVDPAGLPELR